MKKIGKKISYLVKTLMAIGLLFNNIMPLSVVLAEELGDNDQVITDGGNENTPGEEKTPGENNDELGNNDATNDGTGGSDDGGDPFIENPPADEPTEEVFTVELNDEYQLIIKYVGDYPEEGSLAISENITYIDGTNSGDVNSTIELTDEVKALLSGDGYVIDSQILMTNQYPGTYTATATLGEKSETLNETIEFSEMDFEFDLLAYEGEDSLYADVIMPDENDKYVVVKDYKELMVVALIGQGNTCPSMSFTYGGNEYTAEEISSGILLEEYLLDGHLYGEFNIPLAGTFTDCSGQVIEINENRNVVYGTYQDNTDVLNESAKNVGLDDKYVFFGDTEEGYIYVFDEPDSAELENIIKDAIGESEAIEYSITVSNDEVTVTLTDENGIEITYTGVKLSDETTIVARFDSNVGELYSGDTFTVDYVVTLKDFKINGISGLVNYDEELLRLSDISASKFTIGSNNEGKFTYVGDAIGGKEETDDEGNVEVTEEEYVLLTLTFEALKAGEATITAEDAKFYDESVYYEADGEISMTVIINESDNNELSSLSVAGQDIQLEEGKLEYEITVGNDVTSADVEALVANGSAKVTSIAAPEELAVGENIVTITVTAENGDEKVYTIKVTREAPKEENTSNVAPVSYQENNVTDDNNDDDDVSTLTTGTNDDDGKNNDSNDGEKSGNNVSRIIIIILILLAAAGLIYLIFKDDDDDETKKANKDIDKLKKEDNKDTKVEHDRPTKKVNNNNNYKNKNKKGR